GISIMLSHLLGIKLGILIFLLNLPFFYIGYKQIGKTFALSTFFAVGLLSVGTAFLHSVDAVTDDPLLATVFGGIMLGMGVGLVIRDGGSLAGTVIVAILFNKRLPCAAGRTVMFFSIFIRGSAGCARMGTGHVLPDGLLHRLRND